MTARFCGEVLAHRNPDDLELTVARFELARVPANLVSATLGDLGDALFTSGRRIEARFSWQAALITAQDKAKTRLENKLEAGLTPATAAP